MVDVTPPAAQQLGTAVLVQGAAVLDLWYLAALGVRVCRRDGLLPVDRLKPMLDVLAATATTVRQSSAGQVDVRPGLNSSESEHVLDKVTTAEVAQMLNVSHRQAQRITRQLGGRRGPGSALVVDRGAVEAHRQARQTDRRAHHDG